ncbi:hypothetical protein PIB30_052861 [Stylosanthes scabra]|uniref:Peptidase M24 domain-containing protein n=1 Tax=Stylosanthes scabra TaxID=79078 RepID=A0ABU6VLE3_9FABA|nr:hypothetical protein [Stylosanthes scabra]
MLLFSTERKIDMACHIDGFITVVAHTHVLQQGLVTGRMADVIAAANTAAEVALRLVRPGRKVNICKNHFSISFFFTVRIFFYFCFCLYSRFDHLINEMR